MMAEEKLGGLVGLKVDVPEGLRRRVRAQAAMEGVQIREWVAEALAAKLDGKTSDERGNENRI